MPKFYIRRQGTFVEVEAPDAAAAHAMSDDRDSPLAIVETPVPVEEPDLREYGRATSKLEKEGKFRRLIVSTFETMCLAIVAVPTVIGLIAILYGYNPLIMLSATVVVFVVTSFLAGGALTLLDIAHNTRKSVEMLGRMEDSLNKIADDIRVDSGSMRRAA